MHGVAIMSSIMKTWKMGSTFRRSEGILRQSVRNSTEVGISPYGGEPCESGRMLTMRKEWIALLAELEYLDALGHHLIGQMDEILRQYSEPELQPQTFESSILAKRLEN
jgi:hypothetical protein